MYRLELVRCTPEPDGTDWYQWNAEAHGKAPYSVLIEMQKVRAVEYGQDHDGTPLMDPEICIRGSTTRLWDREQRPYQ